MKTNEFMTYEAPKVEIIEVEVEKGFAASGEEEEADFIEEILNGGSGW